MLDHVHEFFAISACIAHEISEILLNILDSIDKHLDFNRQLVHFHSLEHECMDNFSCTFIILIFDADVAEDNVVAGVIPHPPVRITFLFELGTHVDVKFNRSNLSIPLVMNYLLFSFEILV